MCLWSLLFGGWFPLTDVVSFLMIITIPDETIKKGRTVHTECAVRAQCGRTERSVTRKGRERIIMAQNVRSYFSALYIYGLGRDTLASKGRI
jgi:hypothetical protein